MVLIFQHVETKSSHNVSVDINVLYDFLGTVKAAPHEFVIRTGQS